MGCMRSSNSAEGLKFHLRMMVQIMIAPPTHDAITIITVRVVFPIPPEDVAPLVDASAEAEADVSARVFVRVTVVGV